MVQVIVGIDPGKTGGVAMLIGGIPKYVFPMPHITGFADWMEQWNPSHVFLEKAQAFPKQGVSSVFNYGDHFGQLQGVLVSLKLKYTLVVPSMWMKKMHMGTRGAGTKERSVEAAYRLFGPSWCYDQDSRSKKPHLGMVEALLIAGYGDTYGTRPEAALPA